MLLAACAWGGWTYFSNDAIRMTDDAYVGGQVVQVTPQVAGTVTRVLADNTDRIVAGSLLVEIDPTDAKVELAAAEAQLAQAVRTVRGLYANDARYDAEIRVRQADLNKVRADLRERRAIAGTGAVTGEDVRHAADAVFAAEAALASANEARAQAFAQIDGVTLASHPAVQTAAQRVRAAALAVERSRIVAPVSGMIGQRTVQLGRRVAPGDRLMAVVPLDRLWVDANFKEVQLKGVCPGQSATVTADIYGKSVVYHGLVEDIEAGTGAAFALLPAQNATGNWIKVVQRAPVRVSLDPTDLACHSLRIGMSTRVEIKTGPCDPQSAANRKPKIDDASALYDAQAAAADAYVDKIIAASTGVR
jgi:membrane fusion protein (multidrug efflux system)